MSFYKKPPWWLHHIGIQVSSKGRVYIYLWNWVWEPKGEIPNFGDCILGILSGYKPTKRTAGIMDSVIRLGHLAKRILNLEEVNKSV